MRQAMLMRSKALNCTFDKERGVWISPPEFNGISDQQRDELQNFIAERGLDVKTVCEHFGIDALTQIEAAKLAAVKQEIEILAKNEIAAFEINNLENESSKDPVEQTEILDEAYQKTLDTLLQRVSESKTTVEVNAVYRYTRGWSDEQMEPLLKAITTRLALLVNENSECVLERQS